MNEFEKDDRLLDEIKKQLEFDSAGGEPPVTISDDRPLSDDDRWQAISKSIEDIAGDMQPAAQSEPAAAEEAYAADEPAKDSSGWHSITGEPAAQEYSYSWRTPSEEPASYAQPATASEPKPWDDKFAYSAPNADSTPQEETASYAQPATASESKPWDDKFAYSAPNAYSTPQEQAGQSTGGFFSNGAKAATDAAVPPQPAAPQDSPQPPFAQQPQYGAAAYAGPGYNQPRQYQPYTSPAQPASQYAQPQGYSPVQGSYTYGQPQGYTQPYAQPYGYGQPQYMPPQNGYYNQPAYGQPAYLQQPPAALKSQIKSREQYKFEVTDYDKLDKNAGGRKAKQNKAVIAFVSILLGLTLVGYVFTSGLADQLTGGVETLFPSETTAPADIETNFGTGYGNGNEQASTAVVINDRPASSEPALADGEMSTKDIAKIIKPINVGVVTYAYNQQFFAQEFSPNSQGSGVIFSADGYIVTNAHVVDGADEVKVILFDETEHEAQIIGIDTKTDLAVLKIDAKNLAYAEFGNSDQLEVGERVVAVGNPLGIELAGSVTQGIVSAIGRPVSSSSGYTMKCVQIDAAISPGNSGGALVNVYGQVVGINSSKIVAEYFEGIGFAIPINEAKPIIEDLIAFGMVKGRAKLGISVHPIDTTLAAINRVPPGLFVVTVEAGSDFERQGGKTGDIITEVDGKKVYNFSDLLDFLGEHKPGDVVEITLYRWSQTSSSSGTEHTIRVTLAEDLGSAEQSSQSGQGGTLPRR